MLGKGILLGVIVCSLGFKCFSMSLGGKLLDQTYVNDCVEVLGVWKNAEEVWSSIYQAKTGEKIYIHDKTTKKEIATVCPKSGLVLTHAPNRDIELTFKEFVSLMTGESSQNGVSPVHKIKINLQDDRVEQVVEVHELRDDGCCGPCGCPDCCCGNRCCCVS